MLKWWAQSFLVGIERVVVGFRDDAGTVRRLRAYATKRLPKLQVGPQPGNRAGSPLNVMKGSQGVLSAAKIAGSIA